jgi:tRNA modification GTPase
LQAVPVAADTVAVTNLRQQGAIVAALGAMEAAKRGLSEGMPHEMLLLDLHEALGALDGLTGTTSTEEILGVIFGSFCIGK